MDCAIVTATATTDVRNGSGSSIEHRTSASSDVFTLWVITTIAALIALLTFTFGFGNVWALGVRLGVPGWIAPLVGPAVDLSVLGLLVGTRHLVMNGASPDQVRPARRLLIVSCFTTLALNIADPLLAGQFGKAAFDAVGPLLLMGWSEVGPGFLQEINACRQRERIGDTDVRDAVKIAEPGGTALDIPSMSTSSERGDRQVPIGRKSVAGDSLQRKQPEENRDHPAAGFSAELMDRATRANVEHIREYGRAIASETLRQTLRQDGIPIGATRVRRLTRLVRSAYSNSATRRESDDGRVAAHDHSTVGAHDHIVAVPA